MSDRTAFEVLIIGGGVGGASLATVLARAGRRVGVVEREPVFRDRVRGEGFHPWGYRQAAAVGLDGVLERAGANPLPIWQGYRDREPVEPSRWDDDPENDYPEFAISHPALQNATIAAAKAAGAEILRPLAARRIERVGERWEVTIEGAEGSRQRLTADLLVGADGRDSAVRRWLDVSVTVDPVHHRFGGMLIEGFGLATDMIHSVSLNGGTAYVLPQSGGFARIYGGGQPELLNPIVSDRSGGALIELLAENLPEGAMANARSAGPMAFFPNSDIVPEQIAGEGWVLIGDAAGANDPSVGQGLSLTYRDVRRLSELLDAGDRDEALQQYAVERSAVHATAREHAKWIASFTMESGADAERRRAGFRRAQEIDPAHGGFAFIYTRGPMGLVADEAARRRFFNET
ncbi:MAG: FAD-dependent monooxygenase [Thermomicrobiales bacterium]|nr:FAD-dependent monooxygenase [Thermomicrobiales bacterium]